MIGGIFMGSTQITISKPIQIEISCPHIIYLKYKGFHPIEKKKTMGKINLLIDKFNKVSRALYREGIKLVYAQTGDHGFKKILKNNGLDTYIDIVGMYHSGLTNELSNKLVSMLKQDKKIFKNFIKALVTSGGKIENINNIVENNDYWEYCTGNDAKNLKLSEKYKDALNNFKQKLTYEIRIYTSNTIETIKTFLVTEEEKNAKKSIEFLKKLNQALKTKTKKENQTEEENETYEEKEIKKLEEAFERLSTILNEKNGDLANNEIEVITKYFKKTSKFEKIKTPKSKEYFLPKMNCDEKTKKMILKIMGIQDKTNNYNSLADKMIHLIKEFSQS